jgi:hypothetical protein
MVNLLNKINFKHFSHLASGMPVGGAIPHLMRAIFWAAEELGIFGRGIGRRGKTSSKE